jgi:hypothetical protein
VNYVLQQKIISDLLYIGINIFLNTCRGKELPQKKSSFHIYTTVEKIFHIYFIKELLQKKGSFHIYRRKALLQKKGSLHIYRNDFYRGEFRFTSTVEKNFYRRKVRFTCKVEKRKIIFLILTACLFINVQVEQNKKKLAFKRKILHTPFLLNGISTNFFKDEDYNFRTLCYSLSKHNF